MKTRNNKCSNKAECDNGIPLKVTNQTDPSIKNWDIESNKFLCLVIGLAIGSLSGFAYPVYVFSFLTCKDVNKLYGLPIM
jgi:hypothetical protein